MEDYSKVNFLVGVNGSGKSRLLNSIGQKYLRQNRSVLAISNTVFDKFDQKGYKKLSARAGKIFLKKTIIDSILSENNRIYNILEYLGYEKELSVLITFYPDFDGDFLTYFIRSIDKYNKFKVPDEHSYIDYNLDDLEAFCMQLKEFLHPYNDYDEYFFDFGYWGHLDRNIKTLPIFRKLYELFANKKIIKIDFLLFKDSQSFKLDGASSGESHFLAQMLFLDNSLNKNGKNIILIDEPEISLHPEWQSEFMPLLNKMFGNYKGCHFIIATHSTQILSSIIDNKSFIINLENDNKIIKGEEISKMSADYQLAYVFKEPGNKNEYLTRIALTAFTNVSKNKTFSHNDMISLTLLLENIQHMNTNDPLHQLIKSLEEMRNLYA